MERLAEVLADLVRLYRQEQRQAAISMGLTPFAAEVLEQVGRMDGPTLNELSSALGFDPSWVSRGVQSLVERGLLHRTAAPEDRRAVRIGLTAEGEQMALLLAARMRTRAAALVAVAGEGAWLPVPAVTQPAGRERVRPARRRTPARAPEQPVARAEEKAAATREDRLPPSLL